MTLQEIARNWQEFKQTVESRFQSKPLWMSLEDAISNYGPQPAWNFFQLERSLNFIEAGTVIARSANALRSLGLVPGDRVAVMMQNCPENLALWLANAYTGTIFSPINTRYTARELEYVLEKISPKVLVIDEAFRKVLNQVSPHALPEHTIFADEHGGNNWGQHLSAASTKVSANPDLTLDHEMNIQFTSGTTGFPKGCTLSQRYWAHAATTWYWYIHKNIDRSLCNQMLFYVDGQFNAINSFFSGTEFFCSSKPSGSQFSTWLREFGINSTFYFDALFKIPPTPQDAENQLKILTTFGFNSKNQHALEQRFNVPVRDSYGMSELAPALIVPLEAQDLVGTGTCGLVAPFVESKIVDAEGVELPDGAHGQLLLRSPAMLLRYWGDAEATAQTIKDGWLHTGDLAYRDEAGFHYIVGRLKDMVRRNGENVACAEVEAVFREHPAIINAAVVAVPDETVGEELKVFLQSASPVDVQDVLSHAREHLAVFKVPRYVQFVDTMPLTESGRVQKHKLINVPDQTFDATQLDAVS